ncbi:sigma-70 family RNA polymerase sigma factor [Streptomyces sp. CB04723]|uniref:sigma-70 family RNA polymerase sigma factor n=1 Tax=Streptomyces TaxID=1883 RepID=UPI0015C41FF8|nr:sigma-70 family RNA polymerase sigma factor [Streptomyces sp. CB04723]QLG33026.1 sigma-70 family RNA polymerase sigma factor [Streptomyces sp. CB04723]
MLSIDTIHAAQNNDLAAVAEVIKATESRVEILAGKAAKRIAPHRGPRFAYLRDEFIQVGRIAVWEALGRFTDTTVDAFERYMYTTIETTLKDAVRSQRDGAAGADETAIKTFAAMLEAADGDMYEAARLAQTVPPKGKRLSAERAEAARMAWQGVISIDKASAAVSPDDPDGTLADTLTHTDEELDGEIRPKVGRGAAMEAAQVLAQYVPMPADAETREAFCDALELAAQGFTTPADVEVLEDAVKVPQDPTQRRYVLDAMAVLRSAVSTATEGALTDDLRNVSDDRMAESAEKHGRVNDCLDSLGQAQRDVLKHSFGIKGVTDYGWGDGCDMEGICEALGMTRQNVAGNRSKGRKAFAKRYAAAVSLSNPEHAQELTEAAAAMTSHAGRK